jgi:hypothetical protein
MARRRLLSDEQLAPFWAWASNERAIVRQYTLSRADLDLIAKKRTASNQLGFAVLMCGMRFPGRVLDVTETPPAAVLAFIADQVGVPPAQFVTYRQRPTNRRKMRGQTKTAASIKAQTEQIEAEIECLRRRGIVTLPAITKTLNGSGTPTLTTTAKWSKNSVHSFLKKLGKTKSAALSQAKIEQMRPILNGIVRRYGRMGAARIAAKLNEKCVSTLSGSGRWTGTMVNTLYRRLDRSKPPRF